MQICSHPALLSYQISTDFPSELVCFWSFSFPVGVRYHGYMLLRTFKPKYLHASMCKYDRSVIIKLQTHHKNCGIPISLCL